MFPDNCSKENVIKHDLRFVRFVRGTHNGTVYHKEGQAKVRSMSP